MQERKKRSEVTVLTSLSSPFSNSKKETLRVRNLLHVKGIAFLEVDGATADPGLREKLTSMSGKTNFPQVFVTIDGDIKYVGDLEDISFLEDQNKLDQALGIQSVKIIPKRKDLHMEESLIKQN